MNPPTTAMTIDTQNPSLDSLPSAPIPPYFSPADDQEQELWPSTPPDPPLAEEDGIRQVHIGWLKPHPFSLEIYGEESADKDLVASIKALGIQTPLQVTVDGVVISGHRRLKAAKSTDLETVPVFVVRPRYASITVEEQILEANRTRVKDNEQKVREFIAYKGIETERARNRSGYRSDLVPNSARGGTEHESGVDSFPHPTLVREMGKARDLAAQKAGMAGSTAADGEKVVVALDRLWKAENHRDYLQLRDALLKSFHAGLQLGLERGWIPKPALKPKHTRAVTTDATGEHTGDELSQESESGCEPVDDQGTFDTAQAPVNGKDSVETGSPREAQAPAPEAARKVAAPIARSNNQAVDPESGRENRGNQALGPLPQPPVTTPDRFAPGATDDESDPSPTPPGPDVAIIGPNAARSATITDGAVTSSEPESGLTQQTAEDGENGTVDAAVLPPPAALDTPAMGAAVRPPLPGTVFHLADGSEVTLADAEDAIIPGKKLRTILQVSAGVGNPEKDGPQAITRRQHFVISTAETLNRLGKASPDVLPKRLWGEFVTATRIFQQQMKWN